MMTLHLCSSSLALLLFPKITTPAAIYFNDYQGIILGFREYPTEGSHFVLQESCRESLDLQSHNYQPGKCTIATTRDVKQLAVLTGIACMEWACDEEMFRIDLEPVMRA